MRLCTIEDCNGKHYANGYCQKHYLRWWRHGDPFYIERKELEMHGMTAAPEYKVWCDMKSRCYNVNVRAYNRYGGRGIMVCNRWLNSFEAFYTDMGPKPFLKAQLDRKKNDGNYCRRNCRWVTSAQNGQNRETNKMDAKKVKVIRGKYKLGGVSQKELSIDYGVAVITIFNIIHYISWKNV